MFYFIYGYNRGIIRLSGGYTTGDRQFTMSK
jgi:hypothetical protein